MRAGNLGKVTASRGFCYKFRGSIVTMDHPRIGPLKMQGVAPRLLGTPAPELRPAPTLGDATDDVLRHLLGHTAESVAALRSKGVV